MNKKNKVILISVVLGILVIGLIAVSNTKTVTGMGFAGVDQYYCKWTWPQQVYDQSTGQVVQVCEASYRPFCNRNEALNGHPVCCSRNYANCGYSCADFDADVNGGRNYYTKASTDGMPDENRDGVGDENGYDSEIDSCVSATVLKEWYCKDFGQPGDGGLLWSEQYDCSTEGKVCDNGACTAIDGTANIKMIAFGKGIVEQNQASFFGNPLTDNDISGLQDKTVAFNDGNGFDDYDVSDAIWFGPTSPSVETRATTGDNDYEVWEVALEVQQDSIAYYYYFDEAINLAAANVNNPLRIEFFGRDLEIVGIGQDNNGAANRILVNEGGNTVTYADNDIYIGERWAGEYWRWEIASLDDNTHPTSIQGIGNYVSGPILGVKNYFVVDDGSDTDPAPVKVNDCYYMTQYKPYVRICLPGNLPRGMQVPQNTAAIEVIAMP